MQVSVSARAAHPSVHIKTFGCQMNVYDSERMLNLLIARGFRAEPDIRKADVVLVNTCSVRDKSEHKVLSLLGELRPLKDQVPKKILGVCGCVAQRQGRMLLQRAPYLDLVFGPDSVDRVYELVESVRLKGERVLEAKLDEGGRAYSQPAVVTKPKVSEFLTVMKGCDHFCTYCIVPFVRGREKSRAIGEILSDVRRLVSQGTKEVTFLGQNINTYGKGTGESLSQLIDATARIDGLERIRYLTSHPRDLGEDLIAQFGEVEKLCPQLHLPFQSGSDRILKKMSRQYTRSEYLEKIERLRRIRPDICLSTDVIVGFPSETEEDFELTLELMQEVRFSSAFMFKYSPRPGTRAVGLAEQAVPETVKEQRLARLQQIAFRDAEIENKALIGTRTQVLVESLDKKGEHYSGRNRHAKLVHILNAGPACVGKLIDVDILEANGSNLRGVCPDIGLVLAR